MPTLSIEPLGQAIDVRPGQTILDACLRAGIWLPHACGHGLCGTCKVDVLEGEVSLGDASAFALMDFERDEGKALACTCTLLGDVTIEADIDEDPDAQLIPVSDFIGTVTAVEDLTHDVKGITLALPPPGMHFQPGQYVNLEIPGVTGPRPFSIANAPGEGDKVWLQVRRVPDGAATGWLHTELRVGQQLRLSGPYGQFFVRKSRRGPLLFLAGGTGVSSPRAMILDLIEEGYDQPITLIHGVRAQADLYGQQEFTDLAARHANFRYVPALSQEPDDSAWAGERGFVHDVAQRLFGGSFAGLTAYLCGPPPMIEACLRTLMQGRLFEKHIFTERFLTAQDGAAKRSPVFRKV
jgi:phenol hydroxylase P5 protein